MCNIFHRGAEHLLPRSPSDKGWARRLRNQQEYFKALRFVQLTYKIFTLVVVILTWHKGQQQIPCHDNMTGISLDFQVLQQDESRTNCQSWNLEMQAT